MIFLDACVGPGFGHTEGALQFRARQQMQRRKFILSLVGGAALGWTGWKSKPYWFVPKNSSTPLGPLVRVSRSAQALGTQVKLTVFHKDTHRANQAISRAFAAIDHVESVMSLYRPESQLCRLNREGFLDNPHPDLVAILRIAQDLSRKTDGVFDVTVQPVYSLHAACAQSGTVPGPDKLAGAMKRVDWSGMEVSSETIRFGRPGMAVTLNGIAQGFASDAVVRVLEAQGIAHALIDSGEIGTVGNHAENRDWQIGIRHPRILESILGLAHLNGRCLATSGDYESRFADDFERHHLLDPRTGQSANRLSSVSILAPSATLADALSTAVFILGIQEGRKLIRGMPGVDALFVDKQGFVSRTANFPIST